MRPAARHRTIIFVRWVHCALTFVRNPHSCRSSEYPIIVSLTLNIVTLCCNGSARTLQYNIHCNTTSKQSSSDRELRPRTIVVQPVLPSGASDELPSTRSWTVHAASVRGLFQLSVMARRDAYAIFQKDIRTTARSGPFLLPLPVRSLAFSLPFIDYEMELQKRIDAISTPATKGYPPQSILIDNIASTPAFAFQMHLSIPVRPLGCLCVLFTTDVFGGC